MNVYMGDFEVEGAEFSLQADRMIVRDNEIAFELSGNCRWSDFNIDGVAYKQAEGGCVSIPLPVTYNGYPGSGDPAAAKCWVYVGSPDNSYPESGNLAVVNFDKIAQSPKKRVCVVSGRWHEDGYTWTFSGKLKKYKNQLA